MWGSISRRRSPKNRIRTPKVESSSFGVEATFATTESPLDDGHMAARGCKCHEAWILRIGVLAQATECETYWYVYPVQVLASRWFSLAAHPKGIET